jgi:integrase/recombinase XerD
MKAHQDYVKTWIKHLETALLGGRPYSEDCIHHYSYQVGWFLKAYGKVSVDTLKQALLDVPVLQFSKRQKLYGALRCFARFLIQEGALDSDYLEAVRQFKPKRHFPPRRITVSEEDIEKLLNACENPFERLLVILLSQTGIRALEASSLKLSDIDLEKKFLTITRAKWGKTRRIGLSPQVIQAIEDYLPTRPPAKHDYLIMDRKRQPLNRNGLRQRLERIGLTAKVHVHPHALRRAFVTINVNKGRPLVMLQIACGHNDIATTRSYCMTSEDEVVRP